MYSSSKRSILYLIFLGLIIQSFKSIGKLTDKAIKDVWTSDQNKGKYYLNKN